MFKNKDFLRGVSRYNPRSKNPREVRGSVQCVIGIALLYTEDDTIRRHHTNHGV